MSSDIVRVVKSLVKAQYSGTQLLDYLVQRFNYNNSDEWQSIISDGRIKVNGIAGTPETLLKENDSLEYLHLDHPEPKVDFQYKVIHEDDHFLVLDKPGNLPVHPAGKFFHNTLWSALKKEGYEPHFVNRLDRETSGLIIVALDKETASRLGKQVQSKSVYKEYLAIVEGAFPKKLDAKGYLTKDPESKIDKKFIYAQDPDFEKYGKSGVDTSFDLIEKFAELSLIRCVIRTGKMHQIRATLRSIGFPVTGDKMYGVDEANYLKFIRKELTDSDLLKLRMKRQALHAHVLKFVHPFSGKELEFKSEIPKDMARVIQK